MNRFARSSIGLLVALLLFPAAARAEHQHSDHAPGSDSAAVAAVVHRFHEALETADTAAVLSLLSDRVRVLEGGRVEERGEYLSHHLPGDMALAAAVPAHPGDLDVFVEGDAAWTVSTSRRQGRFRDRDIDSRGAELMVLAREGEAWRIVAVHWSSRSAR